MPNISSLKEKIKLPRKKKGKKGKRSRLKLIAALLIILAAGIFIYMQHQRSKAAAAESEVDAKNLGRVERGTVTKELTSSGSLEAKDTYAITSLVEGEIISADFEEGDIVYEGQVLYVIDPTDMERSLDSAERSLETAKKDLEEAKEDYDELLSEFSGNVYRSNAAGYVKSISVTTGDSVGGQGSTQIGELYNDNVMEIRIPFLTGEANALSVGAQGVLTIADTGEEIPGQVTAIANLEETLTGGTLVKYVTMIVTNPGGLSTADTATARFGDIYSAGDGSFEPYLNESLKCDLSEQAKVGTVLVTEGQYVSAGTPLFTLTSDSVDDALKASKDKVDSAQTAYDNAVDKYDEQHDSLEDYTITAPISGTVIAKNSKVGDKISRSGNSDTTMALIYDLSELTFEMSIDELDISDVEVGQEVRVTADAFEDEEYSGKVTNVSMEGSYSNGVSTYPVTVTLDDTSNLIPSMNVDGVIILEESEDTLRIPSGALQRGNIVYVRDSSIEADEAAGLSVGISEETEENPGAKTEGEGSKGENWQGEAGEAASEGMPAGMPPQGEAAAGAAAGGSAKSGGSTGANTLRLSGAPSGFTAVRVETGLISDDYVEILAGLNEGDEVYVKETESTGGMMMFRMPMGGSGGRGPGGGPGGRR